ncbi:MAG: ROK family protein [Saprospiraceae bacterium]|jgi:polyphosphate glucokinase|nr:ROK family protein [Saprospiraceae bacterium]
MEVLGIDVGGTGIKANTVNILTGELTGEKLKIKTPVPATPEAIIECLKEVVNHFQWKGKKIGIGFPAVIKNGVSLTASNIDSQFVNYSINAAFSNGLECDVSVVNDADSAGIAEMTYGKGKNVNGLVIFLTLGTGIGSAIFFDGKLLPNTELGHLKYKKSVFEKYASNSARELHHLGWKKWSRDLNVYLNHLNLLLSPDLILIGGGVSKNFDLYSKYLNVKVKVENASLLNDAGIIGAAMSTV